MEIDTKDNSSKTSNMDKAHKNLPLDISIKAIFTWENLKGMGNISGRMVVFTRVHFEMGLGMVMVHGKKEQEETVINMKEIITEIKNMGMVSLHG